MKKVKDKQGFAFEVMTFPELVEYGKNNGANIVNGMPWSFSINGRAISHENDECYLIPTPHLFKRAHSPARFTPDDVLLLDPMGNLTPITKSYFNEEFIEHTPSD